MTTQPVGTLFDNAVTPRPKGKLATLVTYLALEPVARSQRAMDKHDLQFERVNGQSFARYREIFWQIGAPWLWFSRLSMAPAESIAAIFKRPNWPIWGWSRKPAGKVLARSCWIMRSIASSRTRSAV